ncbi:MAG: TetR/AcrR family transcriptional regulator [Desulfovibrionaceae bacterium]|nr:TetR/AcrR family transcriptional regulator [Desulfovibrionaceae bacterium]
MEEQIDTEKRIFEAAKRVFVQKGMDGASMQDIATSAKISRTSLHYYFRSKEKLFRAVFDDLFGQFLPQIENIMFDDCSFQNKLERFVSTYMDMLLQNMYLPSFIMNELNKNPKFVIQRLSQNGLLSGRMRRQIQKDLMEFDADIEVSQFMTTSLGLCVFPFLARPVIEAVFLKDDTCAFEEFIEARKSIIVETLMSQLMRNAS